MGAVLTPALKGLERARDLPFASTFCGSCNAVCPVRIDLVQLMRRWRQRAFAQGLVSWKMRWGIRIWAFCARLPAVYRFIFKTKARFLGFLGRRRGAFRAMPFLAAWTAGRDLPAPEGRSFMDQWAARQRDKKRGKK